MDAIALSGLSIALFSYQKLKKRREKAKRKCWTKAWLLRRMELGVGNTLFRELAAEEPSDFRNWIRMDEAAFYDILSKIRPFIERNNTPMRLCISAEERLAVTLRFLATGEDFKSLHYQFRMGECTVSRIVHETASSIYNALKDEYLSVPRTTPEWDKIARDYWDQWQFPNCIGSLDGKHVRILPPPSSGSDYRNYKGFFSLVLMALVKSNYEFIYVDVGTNGRISDGGVWGKCALQAALESNTLNVPEPVKLPNSDKILPHVIVADEAFGLKDYLMRPFPGREITREERVYNYRLSRARRVVENSFGILANRWRFLLGTLNVATTERACNLVLAACTLHNYLTRHTSSKRIYMPDSLVDHEDENGVLIPGTWRQDYPSGTYERPTFSGLRSGRSARQIQSMFKDFFNNEGSVEWQYNRI